MKSVLRHLIWLLRGIQVYALVGRSGTGKSFRAKLVCQKYGIQLIIDDGLLIKDQKILAGKSAKREATYLGAVKTAIFTDKTQRKEVLHVLKKEKFKRILILGTSKRMVEKIADALELPSITKFVMIEDVATSDEIETAIHYRQHHGKHVIPVPAIEVKRNYPRIMADSVKIWLKKGIGFFSKQNVYEKTVIRPDFAKKGGVDISESALTQMILHCIDEYTEGIKLNKVTVKSDPHGYRIAIEVGVPYGVELAGSLYDLQNYIVDNLERFTGILVEELQVTIGSVKERPDHK